MTAMPSPIYDEELDPQASLLDGYRNCLSFIERLHRMLLDVIKDEFERLKVHDVTGPQALLMYNVADKEVTIGELKARGYYLGSNASYTLKKLVDGGYVVNERCSIDRRVTRIKLTEKGVHVVEIIGELWGRHVESFSEQGPLSAADLQTMQRSMHSLERFWADRIRYIY